MHSKLQMKHTNDISQAIGRFKHNLGRVFDDNLHNHNNAANAYFARHLAHSPNAFVLRVAWSIMAWDNRSILIAQEVATMLNRYIEHRDTPTDPELKTKNIGYADYTR